jgi:uncharacterized protein YjbJ (UPF0337 family)
MIDRDAEAADRHAAAGRLMRWTVEGSTPNCAASRRFDRLAEAHEVAPHVLAYHRSDCASDAVLTTGTFPSAVRWWASSVWRLLMAYEPTGTARPLSGKVEQRGNAAGDVRPQDKGPMSQAAGAVQDAYDKTVDAAVEGAQTVKGAAVAGHDFLKKFMEDYPHTTTAIALGIGLLIGYAAKRPPARRGWWD